MNEQAMALKVGNPLNDHLSTVMMQLNFLLADKFIISV